MAKFTSTEILSQKKEVESVEVNKSIWSLLDKINQVWDGILLLIANINTSISTINTSISTINTWISNNTITSGTSGSGSWIKYPDGTMVQWGSATATNTNPFSAFYYDASANPVTFPIAFVGSNPNVSLTINGGTDIGSTFISTLGGGTALSLTGFQFSVMTSFSGGTYTVYWQAIGKWK